MLLVASCYRNRVKLGPCGPPAGVRFSKAPKLFVHDNSKCILNIKKFLRVKLCYKLNILNNSFVEQVVHIFTVGFSGPNRFRDFRETRTRVKNLSNNTK